MDRVYIIAEIGGNFTDLDTGKRLIDEAYEAGVDAVKLQSFRAETVSSKNAVFDMENTGIASQTEYFKKYEIGEEVHGVLFEYARSKGLDIFSTPSHISDIEMLERYSPDSYKIGADDLTNIPFLKAVAKLGKRVLLSTGMATMDEIRTAVDAIISEGNNDIVIMHVVSLYPTASEYVNLNAIKTLKREFPEYTIGYSDHTMSVDACIFAAVLGAEVIEKHFTYDKKAEGPDHMHSAEKEEMKHMVDTIRLYEKMSGTGIKAPQGDEVKNRINNRKSVVYTGNLKAGHVITPDDIDIKRPGMGIPPKQYDLLIGRTLGKDVYDDDLASWSDLK